MSNGLIDPSYKRHQAKTIVCRRYDVTDLLATRIFNADGFR